MLKNEKNNDKKTLEDSYKIINQIFTYVIAELKWGISQNTDNWDDTPLKVMVEIFPKIETTKWFQGQKISISKSIDVSYNIKK